MKPIEDYTTDELSSKINAIKAELEKTANALKKYEEELERRKQEVPLGVPDRKRNKTYWYLTGSFEIGDCIDEDDLLDKRLFEVMNYFSSKESAQKHAEMLFEWRKALVANSKGEPIDIKALLPLLRKGWVAMNKSGSWRWYESKPKQGFIEWMSTEPTAHLYLIFNLKPADDWKNSLMECGL